MMPNQFQDIMGYAHKNKGDTCRLIRERFNQIRNFSTIITAAYAIKLVQNNDSRWSKKGENFPNFGNCWFLGKHRTQIDLFNGIVGRKSNSPGSPKEGELVCDMLCNLVKRSNCVARNMKNESFANRLVEKFVENKHKRCFPDSPLPKEYAVK